MFQTEIDAESNNSATKICVKFYKSVSYFEVGVERVSRCVTDGVVEDPDPALVGHLVTHGDQR